MGKVNIEKEMAEASRKAKDALSRYKFMMFGYWAAIWVHLNRISGEHHQNPFADFVALARVGKNKKQMAYLGPVMRVKVNSRQIVKIINRALQKAGRENP